MEFLSRIPYEGSELVLEAGNDAHPRAYSRDHYSVAGEIDLSGRAKDRQVLGFELNSIQLLWSAAVALIVLKGKQGLYLQSMKIPKGQRRACT
jgi:hypothetical protein